MHVPAARTALFEPRSDSSLSSLSSDEGLAFRRKFSLEGKFIVSHSGNMGVKQGLGVILDAAALNRDDESTVFLIVGDGAVRSQIQERAKALELCNVRFLPLLESTGFRCATSSEAPTTASVAPAIRCMPTRASPGRGRAGRFA